MAPVDPQDVKLGAEPPSAVQEQLGKLFGSYRAEWLREQIFDLFTEPTYFPELKGPRPCVLVGGRGTGKTTVLRCLSYEGQFALSGRRGDVIAMWPYVGLYYRVNTSRVTAFKGPEVNEQQWVRLFAHYMNLELCDLALNFMLWAELQAPAEALGQEACREVAISLNAPPVSTPKELSLAVRTLKLQFEAAINNVADGEFPKLSLQGAPIDTLMRHMAALPRFKGKIFFFLLDEYENFEDYQQQVVNTLIKHSSDAYTFKIGVRELGWRRRTTLNQNEQLTSPADYVRIDISARLEDQGFSDFAAAVCSDRLRRLPALAGAITDVRELLPGLTDEEEAKLLGVEKLLDSVRRDSSLSTGDENDLHDLDPLEAYFVFYWAQAKETTVSNVLGERRRGPQEWATRYSNYKHAVLFSLRARKRGIRKYYAGWNAFVQLAAGNIRYLLELVERSLLGHIQEGKPVTRPVSSQTQTEAAQSVGQKNLTELEGLSVQGARLTKLLLGLGRIFQVMAEHPAGHAQKSISFTSRWATIRPR